MNNWTGIGRLTRDPEMRYIAGSGRAVTNFSIAIDKGLSKDKKEEWEAQGKATADFINIVAWGKTAEFAANYLAKGLQVGITGRLETGSYQAKEGHTVYTTEVNCSNITMVEWKSDNNNMNQAADHGDFSDVEGFQPTNMDDVPF